MNNLLKCGIIGLTVIMMIGVASGGSGAFEEQVNVAETDAAWPKNPQAPMVHTFHDVWVNVNTIGEPQTMSHRIPLAIWGGSADSAQSESVTLYMGGQAIGVGTHFYSKSDTYVYMTLIIDQIDFTGFSGLQYITIVSDDGTDINVRSISAARGDLYTTPNDKVGYFGNFVTNHISTADVAGVEVNTATHHEFISTYDYYNKGAYLQFALNRTVDNSNKVVVYNDAGVILDESGMAYQTSDLTFNSLDYDNHTWQVDLMTFYGRNITEYIDFESIPENENEIYWLMDSYVVGDAGSYDWQMSDDDWNSVLYSKKASIYRDNVMVDEVTLPAQNGRFYHTFTDAGSYAVKMRLTSPVLPHKTLTTDAVVVTPEGESYIHVEPEIAVNTPINITFSYGFTPSTATVMHVQAKLYQDSDGSWPLIYSWSAAALCPLTANTLYTMPGNPGVLQDGMYIFELYDLSKGVVATTQTIIAIASPNAPTENITTSYLNLNSDTYQMGGIMDGEYGIDNVNFSYNNYLVSYNYNHSVETERILLIHQFADFYGTLTGGDVAQGFLLEGVLPTMVGLNRVSIIAVNGSGEFEVIGVNYTVSPINLWGYGLTLSKYEACINEEVLITTISPGAANLTIFSPNGQAIKTFVFNSSNSIKYYFPMAGMYSLSLEGYGVSISQATTTIMISDCDGNEEGIIQPGEPGDMTAMYINIFNFLATPAFWGVIILVGFVGGLAAKTNARGDHVVGGNSLAFVTLALINLFAVVGLWTPYTVYILVTTWLIVGVFFTLGRKMAGGGE